MKLPKINPMAPIAELTPEIATQMREYAIKMRKKYEGRMFGEKLVRIVTRKTMEKFNIKIIDERSKTISD